MSELDTQQADPPEVRLRRLATYASTGVAAVLIAAKLGAWVISDSVAVLASLIDSMLDLAASLVTLFAVRHALVPADREHRFGHGKAEPLAALAQSGFIAGSAALLSFEALERLIDPRPVQHTEVGISVMVLSIVLTLGLVAFQSYVVKRTRSVAIGADAMHYKADLLANLGVIATLIAVGYFQLGIVDALFGLGIAIFIVRGAWNVGRDAFKMLMDHELPDEDRARMREIALSYPLVLGVHDLRTRQSGPNIFIQMHLDFDGSLTLDQVHHVADDVENEIMDAFPGAEVIVHEDPVTVADDRSPPVSSTPSDASKASQT